MPTTEVERMTEDEFVRRYANTPIEQRGVPLQSFGWLSLQDIYYSMEKQDDIIAEARTQKEGLLQLATNVFKEADKSLPPLNQDLTK